MIKRLTDFVLFLFLFGVLIPSSATADCSTSYGTAFINEFNTKNENVEIYFTSSAPVGDYEVSLHYSTKSGTTEQSSTVSYDGSSTWVVTQLDGLANNEQFDLTVYGPDELVSDYINVTGTDTIFYNNDYEACQSIVSVIDEHIVTKANSGQREFYRLPDGGSSWVETGHNQDNTYGETNSGSLPEIDRFKFIHDGSGLTCAAEAVTLQACADETCSTLYGTEITVPLPDVGWTDGLEEVTFTGQVLLTFRYGTEGTVSFKDTFSPFSDQPTQFVNTGGGIADQMIFHDCAFDAVESGQELGGPIYTKLTGVPFSLQLLAPTGFTGTLAVDLVNTVSEAAVTAAQVISFVPDDTRVTFTCEQSLRDVKVRIRPTQQVEGMEDEPLLETFSSDNFAIRPLYFTLSSDAANNPGIIGSTIKTGETFDLKAIAHRGDGSAAAGYDGTLVVDNTKLIGSTQAGVLSGSFAAATAASAEATGDFTYSEVGHFGFLAYGVYDDTFTQVDQVKGQCSEDFSNSLSGGMYGCQFGSQEVPVVLENTGFGRFIPDHFRLVQGDLTPGCSDAASFTYMDQDVTFDFTLVAQNAAAATTANYQGDYARIDAADFDLAVQGTDPAGLLTTIDKDTIEFTGFTPLNGWSDATAGQAQFEVTLNRNRQNPPDGPFADSRFGVAVEDQDGVTIKLLDMDTDNDGINDHGDATGEATRLLHGRLRLISAHGSELLPLSLPMVTEYFNGTAFVTNAQDNCTTLVVTDLLLDSAVETAVSGDSAIQVKEGKTTQGTISDSPFSLGSSRLAFSAPGSGGDGWVDVTVDVTTFPWLQFDWDGDGTDDNPVARATFGIYKGSERVIYLRETTWR
ncbi:MAG: hypothetical protein JXR59_05710 [Desulfuromonadaceae bacterium]|nr:hypothetical protein [Desulfuromonadaceae bacterium]